MPDIINTIYHDDPLMLRTIACLDNPTIEEERKIAVQLRAVEEKAAEALKPSIEALANVLAEQSFCRGAQFGARLMSELLRDPEERII